MTCSTGSQNRFPSSEVLRTTARACEGSFFTTRAAQTLSVNTEAVSNQSIAAPHPAQRPVHAELVAIARNICREERLTLVP